MTPEGLEFFTTRELIDELLRRRTFLGIVVHAEDEMKADRWGGERTFCVRFNDNLNAPRVGRLLNVMGDYIEQRHTPDTDAV